MNDIEITIALLYKKKGRSELTEKEFVFSASMDYRWFTPKGAQKLLEIGLQSDLLELKDELVIPTFDHSSINIPSDFKPSQDIIKAKVLPKGLLFQIVDMISKEKDLSRQDIMASINKKQEAMGIDIEAAALVVANDMDLDISDHIDMVEQEIKARHSN
ncbi:MAG: DUF2240 family protein [Thermoplasmata archaeon]|nr:DUF2240 family protein [Thermoplasmata archaeon]